MGVLCVKHGVNVTTNEIFYNSVLTSTKQFANDAVLAVVVCPSVCLCVRLSVTSRYCIKTATDTISKQRHTIAQGL